MRGRASNLKRRLRDADDHSLSALVSNTRYVVEEILATVESVDIRPAFSKKRVGTASQTTENRRSASM